MLQRFLQFVRRAVAPFKTLSVAFWMSFLLACVIAQAAELAYDRILEANTGGLRQSVFDISALYQQLLTASRSPLPRYTVLVYIDPRKERGHIPSEHDVCEQREFMSHLISRIASAAADVIAIDKNFLDEPCENQIGTARLLQTVSEVSHTVPIVVGQSVDISRYSPPLGVPLVPSLDFSHTKDAFFFQGIVNLESDSRRAPLQWATVQRADWDNFDWPYLSFALRTAQAHDAKFIDRRKTVQRMLLNAEPPYIAFLDSNKFESYSAIQVLCGNQQLKPTDSWRNCTCFDVAANDLRFLRDKIVVVGEVSQADMHPVLGTQVQGYFLQANYIEALLDDRCFGAAPCWLNYLLGFFLFAMFHLILLVHEHQPWTLLFMLAFLAVASIIVLYLLVIHFRIYVNPLPLSLLAVVIQSADLLFARVRGRGSGRRHAAPRGRKVYITIAILIAATAVVWAVLCRPSRQLGPPGGTIGKRPSPGKNIARLTD